MSIFKSRRRDEVHYADDAAGVRSLCGLDVTDDPWAMDDGEVNCVKCLQREVAGTRERLAQTRQQVDVTITGNAEGLQREVARGQRAALAIEAGLRRRSYS